MWFELLNGLISGIVAIIVWELLKKV